MSTYLTPRRRTWSVRCGAFMALGAIVSSALVLSAQAPERPQDDAGRFRFRTGVELINVSATVTDASGRYVSGLGKDDFLVYEDDEPQSITHFSAERVPVSLGLAIDTSGSMAGDKWNHAQDALDRFVNDLLPDRDDEVFLYRFSNDPVLEQGWTTDRGRVSGALRRINPRGGTAMYDTVAEAVPLAQSGHNRKKALVIISDGNDTNSETTVSEVRQLIRESEVLVYAVGIDGESTQPTRPDWTRQPPRRPGWPFPGTRRPSWPFGQWGGNYGGRQQSSRSDERVNASALRQLTDDSGGRTEIVRSSMDLGPATASIADELSQQYFFAYPAAARKDGRWHSIRVETRDGRYRVRARRGYLAN